MYAFIFHEHMRYVSELTVKNVRWDFREIFCLYVYVFSINEAEALKVKMN